MDTAARLHGPNFRSATHKPLLRIRGIFSHQYKLIAAPSFQRTPKGPKCQLPLSSTPAFSSALIKAKAFLLRSQVQPSMRIMNQAEISKFQAEKLVALISFASSSVHYLMARMTAPVSTSPPPSQ